MSKKMPEGLPTIWQHVQDKTGEFVKYVLVDAGEYLVEVRGTHKDKTKTAFLFLEVYGEFRVSIVQDLGSSS